MTNQISDKGKKITELLKRGVPVKFISKEYGYRLETVKYHHRRLNNPKLYKKTLEKARAYSRAKQEAKIVGENSLAKKNKRGYNRKESGSGRSH